jgi:hypothetical protein
MRFREYDVDSFSSSSVLRVGELGLTPSISLYE